MGCPVCNLSIYELSKGKAKGHDKLEKKSIKKKGMCMSCAHKKAYTDFGKTAVDEAKKTAKNLGALGADMAGAFKGLSDEEKAASDDWFRRTALSIGQEHGERKAAMVMGLYTSLFIFVVALGSAIILLDWVSWLYTWYFGDSSLLWINWICLILACMFPLFEETWSFFNPKTMKKLASSAHCGELRNTVGTKVAAGCLILYISVGSLFFDNFHYFGVPGNSAEAAVAEKESSTAPEKPSAKATAPSTAPKAPTKGKLRSAAPSAKVAAPGAKAPSKKHKMRTFIGKWEPGSEKGAVLELSKDNRFVYTNSKSQVFTGTWRIEGDQMAWTYDSDGSSSKDPIIDSSLRSFTLSESDGGKTIYSRKR